MPIDLWLFLCLVALLLVVVWPARRRRDEQEDRVEPMSKEDERDNRELARRREKHK